MLLIKKRKDREKVTDRVIFLVDPRISKSAVVLSSCIHVMSDL